MESIPNRRIMAAMSVGCVVILSGPVGAGKTTIARELVESAPGAIACIEGDRFWPFIVRPASDQEAPGRFRMIMRAMLASARHFARDGYEVIVDFSIPPWFLDATRALLKNEPFHFVVLRPSEAVCAERAATRAEGTIADYDSYHELYLAFESAKRFTISDDTGGPATVAARIRAGIEAGKFLVKGSPAG